MYVKKNKTPNNNLLSNIYEFKKKLILLQKH